MYKERMRMLCLWLVNQLFLLSIIMFIVGSAVYGSVADPNNVSQDTFNIIFCVSAILGLILAIPTALFAKNNYYDMISSGFIRWTSAINLWQGEWKFFFKTLVLALLFYGEIFLFIGLTFSAWFTDKPDSVYSETNNVITKETTNTTLNTDDVTDVMSDSVEIIQNAIRDFLMGNEDAVRFTERAKQDISESTWPEVHCSVEGMLDDPSSFRDLSVNCVGPGLYEYECVCPEHGDKFIDYCTISASLAPDGKVQINRVKWGDVIQESFAVLLDHASWNETDYGFNVPDIMTSSTEIFVDDIPVYQWTYENVCLACWPSLGSWAVTDYPATDSYLTEDVKVKNITYNNSDGTVFSGYTSDGRIWYMKKRLLEGGDVIHAKALTLIYPKSLQSDVEKLIEVVKDW